MPSNTGQRHVAVKQEQILFQFDSYPVLLISLLSSREKSESMRDNLMIIYDSVGSF